MARAADLSAILVFGPISGAHFNPAVSFSFALQAELRWGEFAAYATVQIGGGLAGIGTPLIQW